MRGNGMKWNEIEVKKISSDQTKQSQIMQLECGRDMLTDSPHVCSVRIEDVTNERSKQQTK